MTRPEFMIGVDRTGAAATRTLIVGRTQSGKSTLVRRMVGGYSSLVVIDHKRQFELPRTLVVDGSPALFRQAWPQRTKRVIYRPDPYAKRGADVAEVLRRVIAYGRTAIVVDEASNLCTQGWILPEYRRTITEGASLFLPVYSITQRPVGVHNVLLTEADDVFVFDLAGSGDREKVASFFGDELVERIGRPYAYAYAGLSTDGRVIQCPPLELTDPHPVAASQPEGDSRGPTDPGQPVHGDDPRRRGDPREQVRPLQVPGPRPVRRRAVGLTRLPT